MKRLFARLVRGSVTDRERNETLEDVKPSADGDQEPRSEVLVASSEDAIPDLVMDPPAKGVLEPQELAFVQGLDRLSSLGLDESLRAEAAAELGQRYRKKFGDDAMDRLLRKLQGRGPAQPAVPTPSEVESAADERVV